MKRMITQEMIDKLSKLIDDGGLSWVELMKSLIEYDDDLDAVKIDNLCVPLNNIVNSDNVNYFPSLEDQAGKFLKVNDNEDGFECGEVSGGTKLYQHTLTMNDTYSHTIVLINNSATAIDNIDVFNSVYLYGKVSGAQAAGTILSSYFTPYLSKATIIYVKTDGTIGTYEFTGISSDVVAPF